MTRTKTKSVSSLGAKLFPIKLTKASLAKRAKKTAIHPPDETDKGAKMPTKGLTKGDDDKLFKKSGGSKVPAKTKGKKKPGQEDDVAIFDGMSEDPHIASKSNRGKKVAMNKKKKKQNDNDEVERLDMDEDQELNSYLQDNSVVVLNN